MNFLDNFRLGEEKEDFSKVQENIRNGIDFKGTNLWILIFAIFIASLGLNLNSTAVIIGAMLVSPLMGPIMGLGYGMAVNDLSLLRKSFYNYLFAGAIGLSTSTIYFLLSPVRDAHSEILARTAPNIYDVLIALFGGFAGILAVSSRLKGNVIPGVAIATALMPPLCTAGYGIATWQLQFFFGALYLFIINSVFIALATLATLRVLKFPFLNLPKKEDEIKAKRIVWAVVIVTIIPSLYFGFDMVQQNKFTKLANTFVEHEGVFENDFLLKKTIDSKNRSITLTFGGKNIAESEIIALRKKLVPYGLEGTTLEVHQGFSYLETAPEEDQTTSLNFALTEKEKQIALLKVQLDKITKQKDLGFQIYKELKAQNPEIDSCMVQPVHSFADSTTTNKWLVLLHSKKELTLADKKRIRNWIPLRIKSENVEVVFE